MPTDLTNEERVAALDREKRSLQQRIGAIEDERRELEVRILDAWTLHGINSVKVDGMTLYISTQAHVKTLDKPHAIEWLNAHLGPEALNVGVQHLAAIVREDKAFAERLEATGFFECGSDFVLRSRQS